LNAHLHDFVPEVKIRAFPFTSRHSGPITAALEVGVSELMEALESATNGRNVFVLVIHSQESLPIYPFFAHLQRRGIESVHVMAQSHRTFILTIAGVSIPWVREVIEQELARTVGHHVLAGLSRPLVQLNLESWCQAMDEAATHCGQSVLSERLVSVSDSELGISSGRSQAILLEAVVEGMKERDMQRVQTAIENAFSLVRSERWPLEDVAELCAQTVIAALAVCGTTRDWSAPIPLAQRAWLDEVFVHCWKLDDLARQLTRHLSILLSSDGRHSGPGQSTQIARVSAMIEQEYAGDLDVVGLAAKVFLSPGYLSKRFRHEVGMTIREFIAKTRISKAKELLRSDLHLKAYEVGQHVGYPDPTYFNKLFKRQVGVTPKMFREHALWNS